jgi:hypothetical protein
MSLNFDHNFNLSLIRSFHTRHSQNVVDVDCQTQGRFKLMIELYVSEICHKFQIPYWPA